MPTEPFLLILLPPTFRENPVLDTQSHHPSPPHEVDMLVDWTAQPSRLTSPHRHLISRQVIVMMAPLRSGTGGEGVLVCQKLGPDPFPPHAPFVIGT